MGLLRDLDAAERRLHVALVSPGLAGMHQDLVDAPPRYHVAAQRRFDGQLQEGRWVHKGPSDSATGGMNA